MSALDFWYGSEGRIPGGGSPLKREATEKGSLRPPNVFFHRGVRKWICVGYESRQNCPRILAGFGQCCDIGKAPSFSARPMGDAAGPAASLNSGTEYSPGQALSARLHSTGQSRAPPPHHALFCGRRIFSTLTRDAGGEAPPEPRAPTPARENRAVWGPRQGAGATVPAMW